MKKIFLVATLLMAVSFIARSQQPSPEEMDKQMYENIDKEIERLTNYLDLADWQIFRMDSTLSHDYKAMGDALQEMSKAKISNYNMYISVQDEWYEKIYDSFRTILNDEQWAKYLKNGAAKAKKARDKRAEKSTGK